MPTPVVRIPHDKVAEFIRSSTLVTVGQVRDVVQVHVVPTKKMMKRLRHDTRSPPPHTQMGYTQPELAMIRETEGASAM